MTLLKKSDVSSVDLIAEEMFLDGGDVTLDKFPYLHAATVV